MTPQRQTILDLVRESGGHATADEVYEKVRRRLPRISLGTVYRNLEFLSEHGLVKKIGTHGAQRRFEGNLDPHYHFRCLVCDRVEDVPFVPLSELKGVLKGFDDYEIEEYELEIRGLCPKCRAEAEGPHDF